MGVGGQLHTSAALPPGKRPGTHCIGGWVDMCRSGQVPVCTGAENFAYKEIRDPDRPVRIQFL